jgi:hypothetical protein
VIAALFLAITSIFAPATVDVPPEMPIEVIVAQADATVTAERGTQVQVDPTQPPPETTPAIPSFANNCDEMHWYRANAGLPARFDAIGWRESNCRNEDGVHTSCCYGWWQLNVSLHLRDSRIGPKYRACGVDSYTDVNSDTVGDKLRQACAAKALYDVVGLSAWAATR